MPTAGDVSSSRTTTTNRGRGVECDLAGDLPGARPAIRCPPPGSSIDLVSFPPAAAQQYPRGMKEREPERPLKIVSVGDPVVESDAVA